MARIVLQAVSKEFPGGHAAAMQVGAAQPINALRQVSLEALDKQFVVIVGPSGCGKSTLLRLIAGLEQPSEGTIQIGERVVNRLPPRDRDVAMVFQNYALYPHLSVFGNMAWGLLLRQGGPIRRLWRKLTQPESAKMESRIRRQIHARVREAAAMLSIELLLSRMPGSLSGGERQRVAVGRAFVRRPAAFLFDEPLSNLDAKLRIEMRREFKRLHQEIAATMIYVTHDQVEALMLAERVVVMDQGRVQQVGPPEAVYHRPVNMFVAGFVGAPPMNLLTGELQDRDSRAVFHAPGLRLPLAHHRRPQHPRPVVLGVRPQDVTIRHRPPRQAETAPRETAPPEIEDCRIAQLEPQGDSTLVYLRLAAGDQSGQPTEFVAMCGPGCEFRPGEAVAIELNPSETHLFDADSQQRIEPPNESTIPPDTADSPV